MYMFLWFFSILDQQKKNNPVKCYECLKTKKETISNYKGIYKHCKNSFQFAEALQA